MEPPSHTTDEAGSPDWLTDILPPIEKFQPQSDAEFYGALDVAARYCGFPSAPTKLFGMWQHGWIETERRLIPEALFGTPREVPKSSKCWVARKEDETFLREQGFLRARAIGLPSVYLPDASVSRRPNSLLVVPIHSQKDSVHQWSFETYVDEIESIRGDFDEVVVCVHPNCWEKGYWVKDFQRRGFISVKGASLDDRNGLLRVHRLFSRFEFVTTNGYGSHLAYAALWGAKPSCFGTYAEFSQSDYTNVPFYAAHSNIRQQSVDEMNETRMRKRHVDLFVEHPQDAKQRVDWGRKEVGWDNRLSPGELRKAFGWNLPRRTVSRAYAVAAPIAEVWLPEAIKSPLRKRLYPWLALQEDLKREARRLSARPAREEGSTAILGAQLIFPSGPSCANQLLSIFGREVYKFKTLNRRPRIIDGGANIGLASIYFARNFPDARILAFEADPHICTYLNKNLASFQVDNVEVRPSALWVDDNGVAFDPDGADAGRVVDNRSLGEQIVPSVRLRDVLEEPVDLLKLDVEGAEVDLLLDCERTLENVDRIFVEYHSAFGKDQRVNELVNLLSRAGYRLHIHSPDPAQQPFMHRPIKCGYDLLLEIFAFRA